MKNVVEKNVVKTETDAKTEQLEKQNKILWILLGLCGASALASLGFAIKCSFDLRAVKDMVANSCTKLSEATTIDIEQSIVDKAVSEAANKAALKAVDSVSEGLYTSAKANVVKGVREAVEAVRERINDAVADRMAKEVEDVSKDQIVEDVVSATIDKLTDKLSEDLDDQIGKAGEIYKNIVDSLT